MNEAELLFTQIMKCDRLSLYLNKDKLIDKQDALFISSVLKRRVAGQPLQYILGRADFMGLGFKVTPDVLIPRPETELLIEAAVSRLRTTNCEPRTTNLLDIGSGSGCVAVSLAALLPKARITATDISGAALEVAKENARLNMVAERIDFVQADLFPASGRYGLIVSNPPYVPTAQIDKLQPEVKYEPRIALDGGADGLNFYRRIIKEAPDYLEDGASLLLEIAFDQREAIEELLRNSQSLRLEEVIRDYNNLNRVAVIKKDA